MEPLDVRNLVIYETLSPYEEAGFWVYGDREGWEVTTGEDMIRHWRFFGLEALVH